MSFSRAKLQRFNESNSYTPSPADYNVQSLTHVAGAIIPKSDRFVTPASSDSGSIVCKSSALFLTPNPPRKLKPRMCSDTKIKPTDLFQNEEHLKEKIVECKNKDETIKELLEQIEEYQQSIDTITIELNYYKTGSDALQNSLQEAVEDKNYSIQVLNQRYDQDVEKLRLKTVDVSQVMNILKAQYEELKVNNKLALQQFLQDLKTLQAVNSELIQIYEEKLSGINSDVKIKQQQLQQLEDEYLKLQTTFNNEYENLKLDFELQVAALECKLQNQISTLENELEEGKESHKSDLVELQHLNQLKIDELQSQFENEKKQLREDNEAKVKQLSENFKEANLLAEIQMKEKCRDIEAAWQLKLDESKAESNAILKECQDVAEYNIIQCELEKNRTVSELAELKRQLQYIKEANARKEQSEQLRLREQNSALLDKLDLQVGILEQTKARCLEYVDKLAQAAKDKHTYELTITKTLQTVDALKRRLMKSDRDVEQLKAELEATENSKLQFEDKCNQLTSELDVLFGLCDDKEEQNNLALQICRQKVSVLEEKLHDEVDNYKQEALDQVQQLKNELESSKFNLKDAMNQLHSQQVLIINADSLIHTSNCELQRLEKENLHYKNEIARFTTALRELESRRETDVNQTLTRQNDVLLKENVELRIHIDCLESSKIELVGKLQNDEQLKKNQLELLDNYNSLLNESSLLKKKIKEQESLIGPFRSHLEAYELEYSDLMNQKKDAEKEAKEMGLKYAQLLGHQNQKQKIKHLTDLKMKNYELIENKKELEKKIRGQSKTIENLRQELLTVSKSPKCKRQLGNKENVASPNLSTRLESPGGPLKERN